jgi:3-phenylpropionate/cinnamic acid dioxygenase small subunit
MSYPMSPASLEDWFAIHNLFVRYATALDACDVETVVACFEPDGWLESPVLGRFDGSEGIREFAMRTLRLKREHGVQFRHVVSNLCAKVEGERAHARCYLLDFLTHDGKTELLSPGEYECDLKRTNDAWRFVRRSVTMDRVFALPESMLPDGHRASRSSTTPVR